MTTQETIIYEQPFNESMRLYLRLEYLFQQMEQHLAQPSALDSHRALTAILKALNVTDRPDLKPKLTQTLTQQAAALAPLKHSPQVNTTKLQETLLQLDQLINQLHQLHGKIGENLRQNYFLNQIRSHLHNPVGLCNFNTPAYTLWLHQNNEKRIQDLTKWAGEFNSLKGVITTILRITRDSATLQQALAPQGLYQQTLELNSSCQLIRVKLPATLPLFPEISVGKHRFIIRFLPLDPHRETLLIPTSENVSFTLACCRV